MLVGVLGFASEECGRGTAGLLERAVTVDARRCLSESEGLAILTAVSR